MEGLTSIITKNPCYDNFAKQNTKQNSEGDVQQMFKKISIITTLSTALLVGGAFTNTVDAAANTDHQNQQQQTYKVYYSFNGKTFSNSDGNLSDFWQNRFANYQVNWKNDNSNDKPAEPVKNNNTKKQTIEAPAQKQEAPKQAEQKQEAPAKVEAPVQQQQQAKEQPQQTQAQSDQLNAYEQQVVELTNNERVERGLNALKIDVELSRVAREKSHDMQVNNYFSHTSPTYGSPFDMMKSYGITYRSAGENIARGQRTPEEVVNAWMNSEGHRANILSPKFTHIGVGYIENGSYWTQEFIGK